MRDQMKRMNSGRRVDPDAYSFEECVELIPWYLLEQDTSRKRSAGNLDGAIFIFFWGWMGQEPCTLIFHELCSLFADISYRFEGQPA